MKKVLAGRGAVDYYLGQVRRGLADYYLQASTRSGGRRSGGGRRLDAPGTSWWGGGTGELDLPGDVSADEFIPLYAAAQRPDGQGSLGRGFRQPQQAADGKAAAIGAADRLDDPYERWLARHEVRRSGSQASVAAWDCTFSPVKSVSLLWASGNRTVQRQVWAAHLTAVEAGLGYLQEHAAYVRAGRNGVRVLATSGLIAARMNEWTSRDGDMQLHTHCVVLNRARAIDDGKWRALDGRALLAARTGAGAVYNRVLEAELTRRLGVGWRDRPDRLREIDGIDDELIELFSSRRRAITGRLRQLADAYEAKYGTPPPAAVLSRMAQDATLATRRRKRDLTPAKALEQWERTARRRGRALDGLARQVTNRRRPRRRDDRTSEELVADVLVRLGDSGRATFSRHDLVRAALDVLPPGDLPARRLQERADRLVDQVLRHPALLGVSSPDVIDVPDELRRADGTNVYERPGRARWALRSTLDQEAWLLQVAGEQTNLAVDRHTLDRAAAAHQLGDDQRDAVTELLDTDRRIGLLVGPAGAGKTRTLRAVVDAWQSRGQPVIGLTVSQSAADVLASEADVDTENTAKWLYETRRGRWHMPTGALVLVDEASMVATDDLVAIVDPARQAGGKVLLVGDPAQLAAIHIGGAFDLLADRHGAAHLAEIRRFTAAWERDASLQLRRRDPAALAEYAMRGRIHGGTLGHVEQQLFDAWQADALGTDNRGDRQTVLMIVATNEQAAVMGERARNALVAAGVVDGDGPAVQLADNVASVGDHIVTRRNSRQLVISNDRWVVNGDTWTILAVHRNGAATVRRHSDAATITLPANYLVEHSHLGYATTAHRAQGMTVDACHALVGADSSHQQLYVSATRGRDANHLWVAVDSDRDLIRDDQDLPAPEQLLSRILERRDPDRLAAHQIIEDSQTEIGSLARLGAIYEDTCRHATEQWLDHTLTAAGLDPISDRQWPTLVAKIRQLTLAGHNVQQLVEAARQAGPLGTDVRSVAGVLHWRLDHIIDATPAARPPGPHAAIPPIDSPDSALARQVADLMRHRWRQLRDQLRHDPSPSWAGQLGPRPASSPDLARWLTAATAAAAYHERYEVAGHIELLGPRPADSRPDAQAAFDHAQHQLDLYLARRLHQLDNQQLDDLDQRQQHILDHRPTFNPDDLDQAHRQHDTLQRQRRTATGHRRTQLDRAIRTSRRRVDQLEQAAAEHRGWRQAAGDARATRRQIALVRQQRARRPRARS